MSNYTQDTFFCPKDSLLSGNPAKLIRGCDVDPELANIATAIASKYDVTSIASAPVPFAAGSVNNPSIYLGSSSTTGLYLVGANQLGVTVSGTNALTLTSTGLTLAGILTVSTGGTSIKGGLSIAAPTSGNALTVAGVNGTTALVINGNLSATSATSELVINRSGSTVNSIGDGPSVGLFDTSAVTETAIQHSGGQTEIWQYNGSWVQQLRITTGGVLQARDQGGTMQDVGWRGIPLNQIGSNYTLALSDRGKTVETSIASITITVPPNVFSAGDVVSITTNLNSGSITVAQGTGVTIRWANGSGATTADGNRTLSGVTIATLQFISPTFCMLAGGAGVS